MDASHRLDRVPIVVLMPHSRCNCRCVMCDIWKGNRGGASIPVGILRGIAHDLRVLGTEEVVLSGGEALMHPGLWQFCAVLKELPVRITLLSTGLLLARRAPQVTRWCDEVIVSLDGDGALHDQIRGISGAFDALANGVRALKEARSGFPVSARCVVQRRNFRALPDIVRAARTAGLDRVSFLAADVSSTAFNRPDGWPDLQRDGVRLSRREAEEFPAIMDNFIRIHQADIANGFIVEDAAKLRRLAHYYQAIHGLRDFPPVRCAAPWISAVIETGGAVRPCYFQPAIGNIHDASLAEVLNSQAAVNFRRTLDMARDATCRTCVCTLSRKSDNRVSDDISLLAQRI